MTEQIEKHLTANSNMKLKDIVIKNFLGGLAWGFGTVVGATIVAAILLGLLRTLNLIPGIGDITKPITQTVESIEKAGK